MTTTTKLTSSQRARLDAARRRCDRAAEDAHRADTAEAWAELDDASRDLARVCEALGVMVAEEVE